MSEGVIDLYSWLMGGPTGIANSVDGYSPLAYPLAFPSVSGVRSISWGVDTVRQVSESPYTLQRQVYRHMGERWRLLVELPAMKREHAAEWESFLLLLDGGYGTFLFGDVFNPFPRGKAFGTPVVDGNVSSLGKTLRTRGWNANVEGILKAGDKIQLGNYLHQVLRDANSDGTGSATLDVFPRLREQYTDGISIITANAKGRFQLANTNGGVLSQIGIQGSYSLNSFEIVEAL